MPRTRTLSDEAVVQRAIGVFWEKGYAATSLRDLTRATELSSAALYHRFGDKDGLFVRALRCYADQGLTDRLARLSTAADPLRAIRDFLDELIAISLADPNHRGCLLVNTALDGAAMSSEAREFVRSRFSDVERFFARRLEQAVAGGRLDPDTDVATQAMALLGTVFAIRVMARLDPTSRRLRALADHGMSAVVGRPPHDRSTGAP